MNDSDKLREQVSALLDGQLHGAEFAQAVECLGAEEELRGAWHTYHLVGDVLRSGEHVACRDSDAFLGRFRERLAAEGVGTGVTSLPMVVAANHSKTQAANEPVFRWK